jgi:hypothetical protein
MAMSMVPIATERSPWPPGFSLVNMQFQISSGRKSTVGVQVHSSIPFDDDPTQAGRRRPFRNDALERRHDILTTQALAGHDGRGLPAVPDTAANRHIGHRRRHESRIYIRAGCKMAYTTYWEEQAWDTGPTSK